MGAFRGPADDLVEAEDAETPNSGGEPDKKDAE